MPWLCCWATLGFDEYLHISPDEICQLADRALGRSASVGVSRGCPIQRDLNVPANRRSRPCARRQRRGGVSFTADARKTGSLCERALEIIEQHYADEDLSLVALAMLDVSPNHLSACIKKSEETFINILVRRRMETAQTAADHRPAKFGIARRCGFTPTSIISAIALKVQRYVLPVTAPRPHPRRPSRGARPAP